MAAEATASPRDPLRTFQFRIRVESIGASGSGGTKEYVAGCRTVSGLRMSVAPFETWAGGNNLHRYANPNKITWEPITLEQGLALDDTLENWAKAVVDFIRTGTTPSVKVKRQVYIDVWDPYGHGPTLPGTPLAPSAERYRTYVIHNAWISKFHALPKLDALSSEAGLVSVELIHEGWQMEAGSKSPPPAAPPPKPPLASLPSTPPLGRGNR